MILKSRIKKLFVLFNNWRIKNISHKQFINILAFIIGILCSVVAIILKNTVFFIHSIIMSLNSSGLNYLYLAYPLIGIILTVLFVKIFIKDNLNHGISKILYSISRKNSVIESHNIFSSFIASTLTVGFGGSVGLEAPIVLTGSAIGSNAGRFFKLDYKTLTVLIGCGAAGAIGGIFKAPIAAVVFVLEVLMFDLTMWTIIPLLISSITATTVSYFFLGRGVILPFSFHNDFYINTLPYYVFLGIISGLMSLYFIRTSSFIEKIFDKKLNKVVFKILLGGILLGVLIFMLPPLYGEGYDHINDILNNNKGFLFNSSIFQRFSNDYIVFVIYFFLLIFLKVVAMSITTGSGGVGGVFAPTLFVGAFLGCLFANIFNKFNLNLPEQNFILAGMAGLMSGVMHAPLTAIFLIAEITGSYSLIVPLVATSVASFISIYKFEPHSIYARNLAQKKLLLTHHKDKSILTLINIKDIVETDFSVVNPNMTLGDLIKVISKSKRNIFPVVNEMGYLIGVVLLDNIRHIMFNVDLYNKIFVRDILNTPEIMVSVDDTMENVLQFFDHYNIWNIPVVENGKYIGFLSRSKIFAIYRKKLLELTEE